MLQVKSPVKRPKSSPLDQAKRQAPVAPEPKPEAPEDHGDKISEKKEEPSEPIIVGPNPVQPSAENLNFQMMKNHITGSVSRQSLLLLQALRWVNL